MLRHLWRCPWPIAEDDDEWTCDCGRSWRLEEDAVDLDRLGTGEFYWRRVS